MAARTTAIPYPDFDFTIAGLGIEGMESGELSISQDLHTTVDGDPDYDTDYCRGMRSWQITGSGSWVETNAECGSAGVVNVAGGSDDLKGVGSFTVSCERTMIDVSSQSSSGSREFLPGRKDVGVTFNGVYFDAASTGANWSEWYADVAEGTGTGMTLALEWGSGSTMTGTAYGDGLTISRPDDGKVELSGSAKYTGTVTDGSAGGTNIDKIVNAFFAGTSVSLKITTAATTETQFVGTAYPSSISWTVPFEGKIEFSYTLQGSGALVDSVVT